MYHNGLLNICVCGVWDNFLVWGHRGESVEWAESERSEQLRCESSLSPPMFSLPLAVGIGRDGSQISVPSRLGITTAVSGKRGPKVSVRE